MNVNRLLYSLLPLLCLLMPAAAAAVDGRYDIVFTHNQRVMTVKACFGDNPPDRLVNRRRGASGFIKKAYVVIDEQPQALLVRNGRILTAGLHGQDCLHYQVDFLRVMNTHQNLRFMAEKSNHVRTEAAAWLWLPESYAALDVIFHLDEGYRVSAPWRLIDSDAESTHYRLHPGHDNGESLVYFGRMRSHVLPVGDTVLRLSIMGDIDDNSAGKLIDWIDYGAQALTRVYGHFPATQLPVLIFPVGPDREIVPWGEIKREGGNCIHLYVDHTRPLAGIIDDWTLVHELSHTLHPYISMEGRWLSEGLATYYQNVLQARAGVLSSREAWTKLHQGFERGIAETRSGRKLKQVSRNMHENRQYMRVYWSGTALWLRADWLLRTRHDASLDALMKQFHDCCLASARTWSPLEYMQMMDRLSGTGIFTDMYHEYANSDEFPDLSAVYRSLGLKSRGYDLELVPNAPQQRLVQAIMSAQPDGQAL